MLYIARGREGAPALLEDVAALEHGLDGVKETAREVKERLCRLRIALEELENLRLTDEGLLARKQEIEAALEEKEGETAMMLELLEDKIASLEEEMAECIYYRSRRLKGGWR